MIFGLLRAMGIGGVVIPPVQPPEILGGGGKVRREWIDLYEQKPKKRTIPLVKVSVVLPEIALDSPVRIGIQNPRPVALAAHLSSVPLIRLSVRVESESVPALIDRLLLEHEEFLAVIGADDE